MTRTSTITKRRNMKTTESGSTQSRRTTPGQSKTTGTSMSEILGFPPGWEYLHSTEIELLREIDKILKKNVEIM